MTKEEELREINDLRCEVFRLVKQGNHEQSLQTAITAYDRTEKWLRDWFTERNEEYCRESVKALLNCARTCENSSLFEESEKYYLRLIETQEELCRKYYLYDHFRTLGDAHCALGQMYLKWGKRSRSEEETETGTEIRQAAEAGQEKLYQSGSFRTNVVLADLKAGSRSIHFSKDGFRYCILPDGTAGMMGFMPVRDSGEDELFLCIPEELESFKVSAIADHAFSYTENLTGVRIPDCVVHIGANPFSMCPRLTRIELAGANPALEIRDHALISGPDRRLICLVPEDEDISDEYSVPEGIEAIGEYAFAGCRKLKRIHLPDSIRSIGDGAFSGCVELESINIPERVECLGGYAFSECEKLQEIHLPAGLWHIGDLTFSGCKSLRRIFIPENVISIGNYAFDECTQLEQVWFPASLYQIGINPFIHCNSLTEIIIPPENPNFTIQNNCLMNCREKMVICCLNGLQGSRLDIPEGTVTIGEFAFFNCGMIRSVSIPGSVKTIEWFAFDGCENLEVLELKEGIKEIGGHAFANCVRLKEIMIPQSTDQIEDEAFDGCESMTATVIKNSCAEVFCNAYNIPYRIKA